MGRNQAVIALLLATWPRDLRAQQEDPATAPPNGSAATGAPPAPSSSIAPTQISILPRAEGDAPRVLPLGYRASAAPVLYPIDYNLGDPSRDVSSYARALLGGMMTNYAAWQWDYFSHQQDQFEVTREIIGDNAAAGFEYDEDSFKTNFFAHPYHGSLYWSAARGSGLTFWESLPFPWIGSFMWELMGETQKPSVNDLIDTSFGGTIIGEALFRLANEVLDDSLSGPERTFRELGAAALSPMYGLQRVASGRAFRDGYPPRRKTRTFVQIEGGINRLTAETLEGDTAYEPSLHVGIDVVYGDLLPEAPHRDIQPFQFFEAYAATSFLSSDVRGGQLYIQGPMYGWNQYIGDEDTTHPDNNVVAITQFIDFESANLVEYGGLGLGLGDYLVWRFRKGMRYRLSGDIGPAVLAGVTRIHPETDDIDDAIPGDGSDQPAKGRTYDFSVGGSIGLVSRLNMKRFGELGFRGRHYLTAVIDGEPGTEVIGYYRFWYELPLFERMGVGVAPILVQRTSQAQNADPRVLNVSTVMGELYLFGSF